MKKIRIGITIRVDSPTESIFSNGIKQNAIFMRDLYLRIDFVESAHYVNLGKQNDLSQSPWREFERFIINASEVADKIDVLIVCCAAINAEMAQRLKNRGVRIVHHILGNEFYSFVESALFKNDSQTMFTKETFFDAVWISPHLFEMNKDIFEVAYECEASPSAYVWSPRFLEHHAQALRNSQKITSETYAPVALERMRIGVFEPNLSFVKNCIFPILIGEKLEKRNPAILDSLNLFGALELKDKKILTDFVKTLNIQTKKKIFFEDRFPIAWTLFRYTDLVLSHTHKCDLNYLYFDAAWLGFPLVHNSRFIDGLGWCYGEFNADDAVTKIEAAFTYFESESNRREYLASSRAYISAYFPTHERNVASYQALLSKLF